MRTASLRITLLVVLLFPALCSAGDPQRLQTTPRISSVTVYPDRAMTRRTATLSLKPGIYLVAFENLPSLVQEDSVRVEGKGSAGVTIVGMEIKRVFLDQSGGKRVREIDDEIRALERQSGLLDARKAGLASQKSFLDSIRVAWGERISKELAVGRPTAAELQEASSFVAAGVTRAEESSRDLDAEKRQIRDRIDALRRQREETAGGRRESKTVEVSLETAREGSVSLELSAVTGQASWEPAYDVRLAADGTTAQMTFRAMVRQQTGEEWKDVELNLSTARPAAGGAPPELHPWKVALQRPVPMAAPVMAAAPMPRSKTARAMADNTRYESEEAKEDAPAEHLTAQLSGEQSSVSFRVARTVDIPPDNTPHSSVVATELLPVSLEFLAVPKLSPHVFLRSEIVNRVAYPLLPGRVNAFSGSTFTGSSYLKKVAPGEKFDLYFGTDDQMTVKRDELKQHREAGLFGRNRMEYRYRIEVGNFRGDARIMTIRDQLPLAGDGEIKVSLEDPLPKPDEIRDDGRLTWKLPLKAGEKRELTFGISVEYPKEREVTGL